MAKGLSACELGPIRFFFPDQWEREALESDDRASVSLQSPGASFAIVAVFEGLEDPEAIVEQALSSLRDEHPALELEEFELADFPLAEPADAFGVEAVFFSLDTLTYCWLYCWHFEGSTVFAMMQSTDREQPESEAVFNGICRSVRPLASKLQQPK